MPTDSTPGPISHTEGTAMPCHAMPRHVMLCYAIPCRQTGASDRQQYDWSVAPGEEMTGEEEAQNSQSEILCFFL
ncbi:hypothetical protein QR685DRAFT_523164 [Neurospora intermedia]|uniref:Uncharacterized protein n=1 Tax=Neurospora intermedia TaxID=5142 RepID=A0ABR3DC40_NEUIN